MGGKRSFIALPVESWPMRYVGWIVAALAAGSAAAWAWYVCGFYLFLAHEFPSHRAPGREALLADVQGWAVAFGPLVTVMVIIAARRLFLNRTLLAVAAVLLIGLAFVVAGVARDQRLLVDGKGIGPGDASGVVQASLGKPSWRGPCGTDNLFVEPHGSDCKVAWVYNSSFAPMNPSYLVIQLNGQDQVIWVDWINSP
jgi:hypothetical protein